MHLKRRLELASVAAGDLFDRTSRLWKGHWKGVQVVRIDEEPDIPKRRTLYVIGEGATDWIAVMRCPCGCGETLELNLVPPARPRWTVDSNADGTASLAPSVWRQVGCGSHFWLKEGRVRWC